MRMFSYIEFPRALGRSEALVTRMFDTIIIIIIIWNLSVSTSIGLLLKILRSFVLFSAVPTVP